MYTGRVDTGAPSAAASATVLATMALLPISLEVTAREVRTVQCCREPIRHIAALPHRVERTPMTTTANSPRSHQNDLVT